MSDRDEREEGDPTVPEVGRRFSTLDAFLSWAQARPGWELVGGEAAAPPPPGAWVEAARRRVAQALNEALETTGKPLMAKLGARVRVSERTILAPDVAVVDAPEPAGAALAEPVLVVEILSGWSVGRDLTAALKAWALLPSVAHALFVDPRRRLLLHAVRRGGRMVYALHERGPVEVDALGIVLRTEALFAPPAKAGPVGPAPAPEPREPYSDLPLSGLALPDFATIEDFMAWYEIVPGKERFELVVGEARSARLRAGQSVDGFPWGYAARIGGRLLFALHDALKAAPAPRLDVFGLGLLVRIDGRTALAPDVMVCPAGRRADPDDAFAEPVLVAEILTPQTALMDATAKLDAWLRRPGLRHLLMIDPQARTVLRCDIRPAGVRTTLHREGGIPLDALDATLAHAAIFDR